MEDVHAPIFKNNSCSEYSILPALKMLHVDTCSSPPLADLPWLVNINMDSAYFSSVPHGEWSQLMVGCQSLRTKILVSFIYAEDRMSILKKMNKKLILETKDVWIDNQWRTPLYLKGRDQNVSDWIINTTKLGPVLHGFPQSQSIVTALRSMHWDMFVQSILEPLTAP